MKIVFTKTSETYKKVTYKALDEISFKGTLEFSKTPMLVKVGYPEAVIATFIPATIERNEDENSLRR